MSLTKQYVVQQDSVRAARTEVSAKAFIVHDGKVLLLRESDTYCEGTQTAVLTAPGGRINCDETVIECLKREIREETGLALVDATPFHVDEWTLPIRGALTRIIAIFFICQTTGDISLGDEHCEYHWVDPRIAEDGLAPNLALAFSAYLKSLR